MSETSDDYNSDDYESEPFDGYETIKSWPSLFIPKSNRITEWIVYTLKKGATYYVASKSRIYPSGKWKIEDPKAVSDKNIGKKNERIGSDQAAAEAQAKLDVKVRKNHATFDISIAQKFFENEGTGNIDKYELRPMLGKDIVESVMNKETGKKEEVFAEHRLNYPVIVQKKLNGVHVMVFYDEKKDKVILMSRTGLIFNVFAAIETALKPWFVKNKTCVIDGELYSHDEWSFQALSGITRKKKLEDLNAQQKAALNAIIVNVFDFINLSRETIEYGYSDRMSLADETLGEYLRTLAAAKAYVPCEIIEYYEAKNKKQIDKIYKKFLDEGYEGAMIRNDNLPFIFGKRVSDRLYKYKPVFDDEFKLVGYEEASGKLSNTPIWIFVTKDLNEFKVTPRGTILARQKIFNELQTASGKKKYLNKFYTVEFYGYSEDGIPTHANIDTPPVNKHDGGI